MNRSIFVFTLRVAIGLLLLSCFGSLSTCANQDSSTPGELLFEKIVPAVFFFTHPEPHVSANERHGARNELLHLVDSSRFSIRMWCYGLNDPELVAALVRARERGVRVSIIGSPERDYADIRASGLDVSTRASSGLQHVKLVIFDETLLFSGTGNFTTSGFFYNNNAFWKMRIDPAWAGELTRALNAAPDVSAPPAAGLGEPAPGIRTFIAPVNGRTIQTEIIRGILSAKTHIAYMSFSHTDPLITAALFLAARRGVLVEGIYDRDAFSKNSQARRLNDALGVLPAVLYRDGNRRDYQSSDGVVHGGHLHHKTLVIDGMRVLTGSYNWSMSARDRNLEILFSFEVAGPVFLEEFARVRAAAERMPRSPNVVAAAGPSSARFRLERTDSMRLCSEDAPMGSLIRFAGHGPYFRGEYAAVTGKEPTPGPNSQCRPWEKFSATSAGPRGFAPTTPETENFEAIRGPGEIYIALNTKTENLPCENPLSCEPLELERAWKRDGLLLTIPNSKFTNIRFLGPQGLGPRLNATRVGVGLYAFDPAALPGGDLVVFLSDATGRVFVGCIRSGKSFTGVSRDFLESFGVGRGRVARCAVLE